MLLAVLESLTLSGSFFGAAQRVRDVHGGRKTGTILVDTGRCGSKLDKVGLI